MEICIEGCFGIKNNNRSCALALKRTLPTQVISVSGQAENSREPIEASLMRDSASVLKCTVIGKQGDIQMAITYASVAQLGRAADS